MEIQSVKPLMLKTLMILLFTLVGLLICEGLVRLLPQELTEYNKALKGDPLLGIPIKYDITKDFPQKKKPADVYRIVVLGDSHMTTVKHELSYPEVLETLLNKGDLKGKRVEIYNAGAPGHSHYQYYLELKRILEQYDLDMVIVSPYIGNDFLDLYRNDDRPNLSFDGEKPVHKSPIFYKFYNPHQDDGMLELSTLYRFLRVTLKRAVGYVIDRTTIVWGIGKKPGAGNIAAAKFLYPVIRGFFIQQHIFRQSMLQTLFLERFPEERKVIDRVNFRVIELMKEITKKNGLQLLYVPIPTKVQIEPNSYQEVLKKTLEVCDLDRGALRIEDELNNSLNASLVKYGINYIDVRKKLKQRANEGVLYDETDHSTAVAHKIIAKILYDVVAPKLMK